MKFILLIVFASLALSGCATKYLMKNCQDSALKTKNDEPVSACQKQWEYWN